MALWGTADALYSPGTVSVDYATKTITGTATSFTAAGIAEGTIITIGAGGTFGSAVISGITSARVISIATTQYLSGAAIAGVAYTLSQRPVYTLEDAHYASSSDSDNKIYGVDIYETNSTAATQYAVQHAGWVGIKTYMGSEGEMRVRTETLVAFSGVTTYAGPSFAAAGDAADDAVYPDRIITITSQPSSVGVGTTETATFSVAASVSPAITLSYQWQYSSTGVAYTNLSNNSTYSGTTTTGLGVTNTDASLDGTYYRVVVTADEVTKNSDAAVMTVS
jgi:hypothetical protein